MSVYSITSQMAVGNFGREFNDAYKNAKTLYMYCLNHPVAKDDEGKKESAARFFEFLKSIDNQDDYSSRKLFISVVKDTHTCRETLIKHMDDLGQFRSMFCNTITNSVLFRIQIDREDFTTTPEINNSSVEIINSLFTRVAVVSCIENDKIVLYVSGTQALYKISTVLRIIRNYEDLEKILKLFSGSGTYSDVWKRWTVLAKLILSNKLKIEGGAMCDGFWFGMFCASISTGGYVVYNGSNGPIQYMKFGNIYNIFIANSKFISYILKGIERGLEVPISYMVIMKGNGYKMENIISNKTLCLFVKENVL